MTQADHDVAQSEIKYPRRRGHLIFKTKEDEQEFDRKIQHYKDADHECVKRINEKISSQANKDDRGKARLDLLPPDAMQELVQLYTDVAGKYGERNWENGMSWSHVFSAMMRHAWAFWRGQDLDDDPVGSKQYHMASVAWCALTLLAYTLRSSGVDDRNKI